MRRSIFFVVQAEDGIRDLVRSRGLVDVYKRQRLRIQPAAPHVAGDLQVGVAQGGFQIGGKMCHRQLVYLEDSLARVVAPLVMVAPQPVSYTHLTLPASDLV